MADTNDTRHTVHISEVNPQTLDASLLNSGFGGIFLLVKVEGEFEIILGNMGAFHVTLLVTWLTKNNVQGFCYVYGGGIVLIEETVKLAGSSGSYGSLGIGMKPTIESLAERLGMPIVVEYREHREEIRLENILLNNHLIVAE